MKCPDCGTKLKQELSYSIPRGRVRKLKCSGCSKDFFTTELIQEDGNFFRAVYNRYATARAKERKRKRAETVAARTKECEAITERVKEREANEQRTPEKLSSN